jgi:hypothetical protein
MCFVGYSVGEYMNTNEKYVDEMEMHVHVWEELQFSKVFDHEISLSIPVGTKWTYKCEECLEIKTTQNY